MRKRKVIFLLIAVSWLIIPITPIWAAPQYLGQSTWTISIEMNENGIIPEPYTGTISMGITRMGNVYYSVQGYLPLADDGPVILAGGGVLIGETLYLNLSGTQKHTDQPNRDTEVIHLELDKNSLNGTYYSVGRDFNLNDAGPSPVFDSRFQSGTFTLTGSPISLNSNLVGATMLLIDK